MSPDSTVLVNLKIYRKSLLHSKVGFVLVFFSLFEFPFFASIFDVFQFIVHSIYLFSELHLDSSTTQANTKIIRSLWNYCVYTNGSSVYFCGCINGESNQERRLSFEYPIKDVACAESFCLVLLDTGTAYKINCRTFETTEINSTILQRSTPDYDAKGSKIFGNFSAHNENELNSRLDEYITHIAAGRSFSIVVTNKNNVYNLPLKIYTFPTHVKIKKISCGNEHCLILTSNGDLYGFGNSS